MSDSTFFPSNPGLPLVAIVGRPNVGKSTLFNRFLGHRKAITDPTPGVTRDPVGMVWTHLDREVFLVDTGGFKVDQEGLDSLVTKRSLAVLSGADLILLVLDVTGITPEDEIFIEALRPYTDRIVLVVNKVDNPQREDDVWNFFSLGFSDVVGISSTHGNNFGDLEDIIFKRIDFDLPRKGSHKVAEIRLALMGKPNTGKSTLLNLLTGQDRAIVSDIPGTTRDAVPGEFTYRGKNFHILDTAGIRRKNRVDENVEYYSVTRSIKSIEDADVVFLMIDSLEGLVDQEKKIAGLVVRKGKGIILVLNKWDLLEDKPNLLEAMTDRVRFVFPILDFAPVIPLSALKGDGVDVLMKSAVKVWNQLNLRIDTARLNKALESWKEYYEPPLVKGFRYKARYITQTSINPLSFVLFVNREKGFSEGYLNYIKNKIRKTFGFSSVPFVLEVRGR